jgi:hypothetical protein
MYERHNSSCELSGRRPSRTQSLSGCCGEEKNLCSCRKSNADRPVSSLFTILFVLTACVYFFLYGLFNDALDDFVCIALNDKIISE